MVAHFGEAVASHFQGGQGGQGREARRQTVEPGMQAVMIGGW